MSMTRIYLAATAIVAGLFSGAAPAARIVYSEATPGGHTRYVIICDNGYVTGFIGGSDAAATEAAGLICASVGSSIREPVRPERLRDAGEFISLNVSGRYALRPGAAATLAAQAPRGYPPHGYPCLGCEPCPGNPTEFCDIVGIRLDAGAIAQGWTMSRNGRAVRIRGRYNTTGIVLPPSEAPRPQ